jgi:hypothetical protein
MGCFATERFGERPRTAVDKDFAIESGMFSQVAKPKLAGSGFRRRSVRFECGKAESFGLNRRGSVRDDQPLLFSDPIPMGYAIGRD